MIPACCRYVNRLPLAYGRLQRVDAERISFALKTPWNDGTTHVVFSPHELLEKLAALVPPPRVHLIRYHGLLAPHAADRTQIVPGPAPTEDAGATGAPAAPVQGRPSSVHAPPWPWPRQV